MNWYIDLESIGSYYHTIILDKPYSCHIIQFLLLQVLQNIFIFIKIILRCHILHRVSFFLDLRHQFFTLIF